MAAGLLRPQRTGTVKRWSRHFAQYMLRRDLQDPFLHFISIAESGGKLFFLAGGGGGGGGAGGGEGDEPDFVLLGLLRSTLLMP